MNITRITLIIARCFLCVAFSMSLVGCNASKSSENKESTLDVVHTSLSKVINLPSNLEAGGSYDFFDEKPVYVVIKKASCKAFRVEGSQELISLNLAGVKGRRRIICYVDRELSSAEFVKAIDVVSSKTNTVYLAYNNVVNGISYRQLLRVDQCGFDLSNCKSIKLQLTKGGRILDVNPSSSFRGASVLNHALYAHIINEMRELPEHRGIFLLAEASVSVQEYLENVSSLMILFDSAVYMGNKHPLTN